MKHQPTHRAHRSNRAHGKRRRIRAAIVLILGFLAPSLVLSTNTTGAVAAGVPISCGSVYALVQGSPTQGTPQRDMIQVNTATGASTLVTTFTPPPPNALSTPTQELNALAIAPGGTAAYSVSRYPTSTGQITVEKYDPVSGTISTLGTIAVTPGAPLYFIGGAVDPTTGVYWLQSYNQSTGWYHFYAFDPATGQSLGLMFSYPWNNATQVGLNYNGNGDIAFDSTGRLYVLMSDGVTRSQIRMFAPPLPSGTQTASAGTLLVSTVGSVTVQSNGIAFGADGYLYAQSLDGPSGQAVIRKFDPTTGSAVSSTNVTMPNGTAAKDLRDLASCAMPSTLTLRKDIVGRKNAGDQFALAITGNGVTLNNTGVTSGSTTGLQTNAGAVAGPVLAIPTKTYNIGETGNSGANLADYVSSYQCVNTLDNNAVVASGTTATGTVTMPTVSPVGANVVCTITNTPRQPNINLAKTPGTVTGPDANGVYTATYTVTATNTGTAAGSYGPLLDTPSFDPNYPVQGASWTGQSTGSSTTAGPYTLAAANTSIAVGATHTYTVSIRFKYAAAGSAPTACGGPGTGLYNSVSAAGETGPTSDNGACDPPPSRINITKTGGSVSGPDASGSYAVTYTVTVANVGSAGSYGALTDTPAFSSNLVLEGATWTTSGPGAPAAGSDSTAPYQLTTGSTAIAANTTHTFALTIRFHFANTAPATACGGSGTGLFNSVAAASGETGPTTDNSACVEPPKRYDVLLRKVGKDGSGSTVSLAGSTWQLQADAGGAPGAVIAGGVQPVSGQTGQFTMTQLPPGTYWLTETQAPAGYVLLAEPIRFVVSATGAVTVTGGASTAVSVGTTSGGQPQITVRDANPLVLPLAGGSGTKAFVAGGSALLLLALAALALFRIRASGIGLNSGASTGRRVKR